MPFDFSSSNDMGPTITPTPADGATNVSTTEPLRWELTWNPVLGGLARAPYTDVYFGTENPPQSPVLRAVPGHSGTIPPSDPGTAILADGPNRFKFDPGPLASNTTYHWAVVVRNLWGWMRASPVYSFTTETEEDMVLDRQVTVQDVVNTATETTVYTYTVPGGTLSTNRALRVTLFGDLLNNFSASQFSVSVKYGGTFFGITAPFGFATNALRRAWVGDVLISAAGATNAQMSRGVFFLSVTGSAVSSGGGTPADTEVGVRNTGGAIDSTVDQPLLVTIKHELAHANISGRLLTVIVEKL